jgi:hypothetical protein
MLREAQKSPLLYPDPKQVSCPCYLVCIPAGLAGHFLSVAVHQLPHGDPSGRVGRAPRRSSGGDSTSGRSEAPFLPNRQGWGAGILSVGIMNIANPLISRRHFF